MHVQTRPVLLLVLLSLALCPDHVWAFADPNEDKVPRQAQVVFDDLGAVSMRLLAIGPKSPLVFPAMSAVGSAREALDVLLGDPQIFEARVEAIARTNEAIAAVEQAVGDPQIEPGPERGHLLGDLAATREAAAKLVRLVAED